MKGYVLGMCVCGGGGGCACMHASVIVYRVAVTFLDMLISLTHFVLFVPQSPLSCTAATSMLTAVSSHS